MQKKLLLLMLVPILALSLVVVGCGGDDDGGFEHNVELVGTRFYDMGGAVGYTLEAVFSRPIDIRTRDVRLEGLRVDRWYMVEDEEGNSVRYLDSLTPAALIGISNHADFDHFWVNIPLVGQIHHDVLGPAHVFPLHESVDAIEQPLEGWYVFRVTIGDVEGYNVTHAIGSRIVSYGDNLAADWEGFFGAGNSGLPGAMVGPVAPVIIEVSAITPASSTTITFTTDPLPLGQFPAFKLSDDGEWTITSPDGIAWTLTRGTALTAGTNVTILELTLPGFRFTGIPFTVTSP